jgi:hypothetical protein
MGLAAIWSKLKGKLGATQQIPFANDAYIHQGQTDLGGGGGIEQVCAVGYASRWEAGRLWTFDSDSVTVSSVEYQFADPTTSDTSPLYRNDSLWSTRAGKAWRCTNAASGSWVQETAATNIPGHAWINESTGNNSTAQLGNPGKPYYNATSAVIAGAKYFHFGSGTYGINNLPRTGSYYFTGLADTQLSLYWTGYTGNPGSDVFDESPAFEGTPGESFSVNLNLASDDSMRIGIVVVGGTGGPGGVNISNQQAASGPTGVVTGTVRYSGFEFLSVTKQAGVTLTKQSLFATTSELGNKVDKNSAITGATKTKITYDAKGLVTSGADATTADIADSTNKRYVTDAQQTVIGNTSGTNTGDETGAGIRTKLGITTLSGSNTGDQTLPTRASLSIDNVDNTSDANKPVSTAQQTALNAKQATLVSGTNIKTVNSTSILGSGDIAISGYSLPTQTGNSGKYLTTNGTAESWGAIDLSSYATTSAVAAGYQPLDSDLTALAALTTTSTGRALLTESVAQTGTGALARADSPTFSGTVNVAAITASGTVAIGAAARFTEQTYTPTGTTQTINLNSGNLNTLSLASTTGSVTLTLTVPTSAASGRIKIIQHGTTGRGITIALSSGTAVWYSAIPTWSSQAVGKKTILAYTWDGTDMSFQAVEAA